jgi:hypothetical protein
LYPDFSNTNIPDLGPPSTFSILDNLFLSSSETEAILKSVKVDNASGPDGIGNRILLESSRELSYPLKDLYPVAK